MTVLELEWLSHKFVDGTIDLRAVALSLERSPPIGERESTASKVATVTTLTTIIAAVGIVGVVVVTVVVSSTNAVVVGDCAATARAVFAIAIVIVIVMIAVVSSRLCR